jgi:hypothetical protein
LVKGLLQRFSSKGKPLPAEQAAGTGSAAAADASTLIPAFRPQEASATAHVSKSPAAGAKHDGAISRAAAQQLKALVAALAEKPAEHLAADHAEALIDWETPYKLEPEEDAQFAALLPLEMPGRPGVLMAAQHDQKVRSREAFKWVMQVQRMYHMTVHVHLGPGVSRSSTVVHLTGSD